MFKTYGEKLAEIESYYEQKDYERVVVDCAKITEQAVGQLFRTFHMSLQSQEKRLQFLEFEKAHGDKYANFLQKPTIGVGIGFFNSLLDSCEGHPWLKPELKSALNIVNTRRNAQVHAGKAVVNDHEAGEVIDATEKFLKGIEVYELPVEDMGFPLKYYLVYTSIKSKFETGETETEFKHIINDSNKLLPDLLNAVFNKIYPFLPIKDKEKLNKLHPKTMDKGKRGNSLKQFIEIFEEINLFSKIGEGSALRNSLQAISDEFADTISRRAVRHHVNALDIIFSFIQNKKLSHFLDYANLLKKKYLEDNKINDTNRIILNDRAKELKISPQVAESIEKAVVRTIEHELILFQTLYEEKEGNKHNAGKGGSLASERKRSFFADPKIWMIAGGLAVILAVVIFVLKPGDGLTNYERAYLEAHPEKVVKLTSGKRKIGDTRAHYHYIFANFVLNGLTMPEEVKQEYRKLLADHPDSPEAMLYLGFVYNWTPWYVKRYEADSSWTLINKALDIGMNDPYALLMKAQTYWARDINSLAVSEAEKLLEQYPENIQILEHAAEMHFRTAAGNRERALELYKEVEKIYPDYFWYYVRAGNIALEENKFGEAEEHFKTAQTINSRNTELVLAFTRLYRKMDKFELAESHLKNVISGFGKDDYRINRDLAYLYFDLDKIEKGLEFVGEALQKFPNDEDLLWLQELMNNALEWQKRPEDIAKIDALFDWHEDFNEAISLAKENNKPLLVLFMSDVIYRWASTEIFSYFIEDVELKELLSEFVTVRISQGKNPEVFRKYDNGDMSFRIIAEDGEEVAEYQISQNRKDFYSRLEAGLQYYKRNRAGKVLNTEEYTEVHNFSDALTMAKARNCAIMVVAGSKGNEYSVKLAEQTLQDPVFKAEFKNLVYLYLEQEEHRQLIDSWGVRTFPTILYFNRNGNEIYRAEGYKPADILADITYRVKEADLFGEKFKAPLNWIYDFKEAETLAIIQQKKILAANYDALRNILLLTDEVNSYLKDHYICVDVGRIRSAITENYIGTFMYKNSMAILDQSGRLLFHANALEGADLMDWLDTEEKMKVVAILGTDKYGEYQDKIMLAKELYRNDLYLSSIDVRKQCIAIYPESPDNYLVIAYAYMNLLKPGEAIQYYEDAIARGRELDYLIVDNMINAHLQLMEKDKLVSWMEQMIEGHQDDPHKLSMLYRYTSELYRILSDEEQALTYAESAAKAEPNIHDNYTLLGKLQLLNGKVNEAKRNLNRSLKIQPTGAATFYLALCYEEEGNTALRDETLKQARLLDQYLLGTLSNQDYFMRPNFYKYPGYIKLIEEGYLHSMKANPRDMLSPNNLAYLYSVTGTKLEDALTLVDRSLEMDPDNHLYLDTKAWILYKMEKYDEAAEIFARVDELIPEADKNYEFFFHKGMILMSKGDSIQARQLLEKSRNIPEPDAMGMKIIEEIDKIIED